MEVNKLQLLMEYMEFMRDMNKNELLQFFESLSKQLTLDELKSVIFCGLNKCKNQIDYDRLLLIKQDIMEQESAEPCVTSEELQCPHEIKPVIWNLETAPPEILLSICLFLEREDIDELRATSRPIALTVFTQMNKIPFNVMNAMQLIDKSDFNCYFDIQELFIQHTGLDQSFSIDRICYLYQNQFNISPENQLVAYLYKPRKYSSECSVKLIENTSQSIGSVPAEQHHFLVFNSHNIGSIQQTESDIEETKMKISKYESKYESSKSRNIKDKKLIILKYFDIHTQTMFIVDYIVVQQMVFLSQIDEYISNHLLEKCQDKKWAKDKICKYLKDAKISSQLPFKIYKECDPTENDRVQSLDDNHAELLTDDDRMCNIFEWPATDMLRRKHGRKRLATMAMRKSAPAIGGVRTYSSYGQKWYEDYYRCRYHQPLKLKVDILIFEKDIKMMNSLRITNLRHDANVKGKEFYTDCNAYINDEYMKKRIEFKYNGNDNKYAMIKLVIPVSYTFKVICNKLANQFGFNYNGNLRVYRVYRSYRYEIDLDVSIKEEYISYCEECVDDEDYYQFSNETCEFGCHSANDSGYESYDDVEHHEFKFKFEWEFI